MNSNHVVFVYGTLRKGQSNRRVMKPHLVRELGEGVIQGEMYDLGAYPAVSLNGGGIVVGEWVEVTDDGLAALDKLEGYPRFYGRTVVKDLNGAAEGWVYHMTGRIPAGVPRVESGDWVAWLRARKEVRV
ncbi:gamma-glutamylcyclotransferase family protein [Alicyclobacillus macrosporangiidus]|uniref:gamma-glutamylcyclotransferase family protein n=1 Tax=Alicyclobacillus macrosporangiidus TaxID=392015 RepID=UPI000550F9D9|nr:gamma-glutamylcyclotransferase family protein [Alicyclobacillus macrosporangiidus]